jgi:acetyltransferase
MTTRNLEYAMRPSSVVLIGASEKSSTVGAVLTRNLLDAGFPGEVFLINPKYKSIAGIPCYPDVASLPKPAELAVIATPPDTVPHLIHELGNGGTKAAVVITAGFGEGGSEHGKKLCSEMLGAAKPHLLRIIGPNCLGIMIPGSGLNASFGHTQPLKGDIAFVAQSGAVQTSVLDWATSANIGFSHFIALGDMADVDFGDMLDYLADDIHTRAILLYMETVTHARKFMSAARVAARIKPVIVVKAGRHKEGARAAASHTGAMAGADGVFDAAFRRAGMLRVHDLQDLFSAVETLAKMSQPISKDRIAILTNGGGLGVLATDVLIDEGGHLAELSASTIERLNAVLPPTWSHGNPVDIIGDAPGSRYTKALEIILEDNGVDGVLIMNCPTAVASSLEAAEAVIETLKKRPQKTKPRVILTSWVGNGSAAPARRLFEQNRIATYVTPREAIRGFMQMVRYRRNQEMLMETPASVPESFDYDMGCAKRIIDQALAEGREWLSEVEAKSVLSAYNIPVVPTYEVSTPEEAAAIATQICDAVALKILSADITHKSDVGGVVLDLDSAEAVHKAAEDMHDKICRICPGARLCGFSVQPMIRRAHAHELIVGMVDDIQFGPVLLFGHGGTGVEVMQDKALGLPPLNMHLARELMTRTRVFRLLQGYRNMPAADIDRVALTLVKISQLVCDIAEIAELDVNPLLADESGVTALDARIRVKRAKTSAAHRLAIRPYPKELERTINLPDGRHFLIRPVKPEDEPLYHKAFTKLSQEEIRLRFLHPMRELSHSLAARLTQIDYDREMALVLIGQDEAGEPELLGGVRMSGDPNKERAEFAILLRGDMTGMGLGPMLMRCIIDYAKSCSIAEIHGDVLSDNRTMLKLCSAFGFSVKYAHDDPGVMNVSLELPSRDR